MFLKRSFQKELMDDFSINDDRIDEALKELHAINKFLGGNSVSRTGINYFRNSSKNNLKILDVGAGISDILHDINKKTSLTIFSVELNKYICRFQKLNGADNKIICADALKMPVRENLVDIVHSSLFLHHFNEDEIINILKNLNLIAIKGIVINDLRRNILAYLGIKILTQLFSKSEFVKNDGPVSVKRSFTKEDLENILLKAGFNNYIIKRKWAFRFLIIIDKNEQQ